MTVSSVLRHISSAPRAKVFATALGVALLLVPSAQALAAENPYTLSLDEHVFTPDTLEVPAGQRIKLQIVNNDKRPEEFDSSDLHVEKIIGGGATVSIMVGPLKPGTYTFEGEFHSDTAKGKLVVR